MKTILTAFTSIDGDLVDGVLLAQVHLPGRVLSGTLARVGVDTVAWRVHRARVAVDGSATGVGFHKVVMVCVMGTLLACFPACNIFCK